MDFNKFAQIALKDIRALFRDRIALVIGIAAPLAITLIMGLALGGGSVGGTAIQNIPVVIVNLDQGNAFANFGKILTDTFTDPPDGLNDLINAEELTDETAARDRVRAGKAAVAIFIPADFSQSLNPTNPNFGDAKITLRLYRNAGSPIPADIMTSVVQQIVTRFANSNIAVFAAAKVNPALLLQAVSIAQEVSQSSSVNLIRVENAQNAPDAGQSQGFNFLGYFAPSLAIFFVNFSVAAGAGSVMEERENGTLQRMLTTPTTRLTILGGKLVGTYVNGVLQLSILVIASSILGMLLGNTVPVWGTNIPGLILLILVVVAAATGLGTIIAGAAKTPQQAGIYGNALYILMGLLGGTFFVVSGGGPLGILSKLTFNYWATNSFYTLTQTGDIASILPNLAVLLGMFVVFFGIGVILFNRRLDV